MNTITITLCAASPVRFIDIDHDAPVLGNPAAMYYLRNVAKIEVASDGVLAFTKDCDTKIYGRSIRAFVMQDPKWKSARRVSGNQNSFLCANFNYPRPTAREDAAYVAWLAIMDERLMTPSDL